MTVKDQIAQYVCAALAAAMEAGELPAFQLPEIPLEQPRRAEQGDYATSLALRLAGKLKAPPMAIAQTIASHLELGEMFAKIEVASPGFINFTLADSWLAQQVEEILEAGETFGDIPLGTGHRVQVEFVSANPTGPLHIGAGRNAALGDALANVLSAGGYSVQREYFINDAGTQMAIFNRTLFARYAQALGRDVPIPEEGYRGHYMVEMGEQIATQHGEHFLAIPEREAVRAVGELGLEMVLEGIREDLALMGIHYDRWFSERALYSQSTFQRAFDLLEENGNIARREGAVWFTATKYGAEKDEVIIRSNGTPGYMAADLAYHYDKFVARCFDWVIDIWGADHHGHIPGVKASLPALGLDADKLTIILYQLVTLLRGGEIVRLSKRTGDIITLREVLEEVGADAVRFFLLSRSADSQMDFDLDLAKAQSEENPVYYIQYAHARIASILRYAQGIDPSDGDVSLLTHPAELTLIRKLIAFPEVVELAVRSLAPHYLAYYSLDLAGIFHGFYRDCRVVTEDLALTKARLKLTLAAQIVLARALKLMGMSVPERM